MKRFLLGIDVGTTGTKSILFSEDGKIMGQAYLAYPTDTHEVHFCEQDPEDWWHAICKTVREVCADPETAAAVVGISLSTQGGTMVGVDENGAPVRSAVVWNDSRAGQECDAFVQNAGSAEYLYHRTGWNPDPGAPVFQIKWIREHEPENFQRIVGYWSVPDYISYKMTGTAVVDISNAGINRFADIRRSTYDSALLKFGGLREEQLAKIVPSGKMIGQLTPKAAEEMGLTTDAVLVSGAHDQYAVALGAGACEAGDILIGSGTCWVVTCIQDAPTFATGLAQSVAAVPGKWGALWSLPSGGICLEWWRKNLTADEIGRCIPYETINREIEKRKAAEDGLYFYPFSGYAETGKQFQRATILGMDLSHDKFHIARAIMEGVAFQIVGMLESFPVDRAHGSLKLTGGAAKSVLWCQMVADAANMPVRIPEIPDLGCVGAAILAGVGCGVYSDVGEGYSRLAVAENVVYPNEERSKRYRELLAQYQKNAAFLGSVYGLQKMYVFKS